jgi:hypothetical protein
MFLTDIKQQPEYFIFNEKTVSIFSFFNSKSSVPSIVAEKQKQVFEYFNFIVNIYDLDMRHPTFIEEVLKNHIFDIYIFFDIDSIPLNSNVLNNILSLVSDNTLFGVAQQDQNGLNHDYAAPSCLCFTKKLYKRLNCPQFVERQRYLLDGKLYKTKDIIKKSFENNDDFYKNIPYIVKDNNGRLICDVAEELTYQAEENNVEIKLWYPTSSLNCQWKLKNGYFGNGTIYNNSIYHQFQIRNNEQISSFLNKCDEILKK